MEQRKILLTLTCKRSGGCCGSSGKVTSKYAVLTIMSDEGGPWQIVEHSQTTSNILQLSKNNKDNLWKGSVEGMGLLEDEDFMAQIRAIDGLIKTGCEAAG